MNNDPATLFLFVLLINVPLCLVVGYVASQKGRSAVGFFSLSFFLSFIVGILAAIAIPAQTQNFESEPETICPFCKEEIRFGAQICKHCGKDLSDAPATKIKDLNAARISEDFKDSFMEYQKDSLFYVPSNLTLPELMKWEKLGKPDLTVWFEQSCPPLIPWMELHSKMRKPQN